MFQPCVSDLLFDIHIYFLSTADSFLHRQSYKSFFQPELQHLKLLLCYHIRERMLQFYPYYFLYTDAYTLPLYPRHCFFLSMHIDYFKLVQKNIKLFFCTVLDKSPPSHHRGNTYLR